MSFLHEPGNLGETPLAAILVEALNLRASGVLEVGHGGGTSRLWFLDGRPVGAQVFVGFKPLGTMLLQAGLIDIDALSRSLALMAETRRPQGVLLIEMGAVSAEDVGRMLEEQQAGYFSLIAALDEGPFAFDAAAQVPEWTRTSRLSPLRTVVDALERPQATALVVGALAAARGGVRLLATHASETADVRWTEAERGLIARLERPARLEDLLYVEGLAPERARAVLAALLLLGIAVPAEGREEDGPSAVADGAGPGPAAVAPAPQGAVTPAPARRSDPAEARARRQRLLQQAMRNMGVGPFAGRPPGERAEGKDAPDAAPAGASREEAQLREALLAVAPRARERDLFVRLGLPETAGRADVKRAFIALARQFHPDRFASSALADMHETVRDFFAAVNEAYEVLSDDRKRAEYVARRASASKAHSESARIDFLKGEACLRTRDWARARGFLESAVRADPRPEYQATLAWAIAADPACKDRSRARALADEAAKDPFCDRAMYVAGVLARDDGDDGIAERHFRAATKVNPRNAEATRDLRLLEARRAERRGR